MKNVKAHLEIVNGVDACTLFLRAHTRQRWEGSSRSCIICIANLLLYLCLHLYLYLQFDLYLYFTAHTLVNGGRVAHNLVIFAWHFCICI